MDIVRHPQDLPAELRGSVAALGNFDGFHRGHQAVVAEAGRLAREMGAPLAVITTEPHPRHFFRPDEPPFRLTPFRERAFLLEHFGVDLLGCLAFDRVLAATPPHAFVAEILLSGFGVLHVVTGWDYRFGHKRAGDASLLRWMGEMEGFGVTVLPPVRIAGQPDGAVYSSSAAREALRRGEARRAADILGHCWAIAGHVVGGERRGRAIGFPTLNLPLGEALRPRFGVYAVRAEIEGLGEIREGVANIGRRPTFEGTEDLLEVHLFDFEGDLYGRHARVELVEFIRSEQKFDGIEALKAQIACDCDTARARLADPGNARAPLLPPTLDAYLAACPEPSG